MSKTIKGYEIQQEIGEGGFGKVYRAFQPLIEREVAIKAILPSHANQPDFVRRFEVEAQMVARLEHPHIVPLYDYWRDPEGAYLVMRWLRGGSLLESLRQSGPWSVQDAAKLVEQLAGALSIAHRNDIVHQDIKPANVLLDNDGNVYLTDFGIAQDLGTGINLAQSDDVHVVLGTPAYMSPEQLTRQPVTPQSDIYSLGIVLYELLTGKQPFAGSTMNTLIDHQIKTPLPPLQTLRPELPEALNIATMKATAKDPADRYKDVMNLAEDFRKYASPVAGGMPGAGSPSRPPVAQRPAVILNPYKGLRPFQEADAADFFGRQELVQQLLKSMTDDHAFARFMAVIGPSGSGKSSVVKAGVIPALRQGRVMGLPRTFIAQMTPGSDPMRALEGAILRIATRADDDFLMMISANDFELHDVSQKVLPKDGSELILVIDQFEEVFTLVEDEKKRHHFLNTIYRAIDHDDSRVRIIITLRADFYDRPLMYQDFGEMLTARMITVMPFSATEMEHAIKGPAHRVGLKLETGLVESLIGDVNSQPNALPLLQYTLTELFEHGKDGMLTLKAYREIGGVSGALARRADEIYKSFAPQQHEITRQLFLRLVKLGDGTEDTRRRVAQTDLYTIQNDRKQIQYVLDTFGKHRLLTFDHDHETRMPTVEIAHEALIRRWELLHEWLEHNRDDLRTYNRLSTAAGEWQQNQRDPSYLATGARLEQFEAIGRSRVLSLNQVEQEYVAASIQQRQRAIQRRKAVTAALISITIVAVVAALIALMLRQRAESARTEAEFAEGIAVQERDRADQEAIISKSRELAATALTQQNTPDLALLLSMEGLAAADTFAARNSLLLSLQDHPRLYTYWHGHQDSVRGVEANGQFAVSGGRDQTVIVWDTVTGQPLYPPLEGHENWINTVAISPDSTQIASADRDGLIHLWDRGTGTAIGEPITAHSDEVNALFFQKDGSILISGGADGRIIGWNVRGDMAPAFELVVDSAVYALTLNPDETILAVGTENNRIYLWDLTEDNITDQDPIILTGHTNWIFDLAFSPDGTQLASASADQSIRLWDVSSVFDTGEVTVTPLLAHRRWVRTLAFHPNGRMLISGGADGRVLFWDLQNNQAVDGFFSLDEAPVWDIVVDADHQQVIVADESDALTVWMLQPETLSLAQMQEHEEWILAAQYSPDGKTIATAGGLDQDFAIRLWDAESHVIKSTLDGHDGPVYGMTFSPDGQWLISVSASRAAGQIIVWNATSGERIDSVDLDDGAFALAHHPTEPVIAVGNNDATVSLWRTTETGSLESMGDPWQAQSDRITALAFSPTGTQLASASRDTTVQRWLYPDGIPQDQPLEGHSDGALSLAYSPDGRILASGGRDWLIYLWDTETGTMLDNKPLRGHEGWVMSLDFSPDNRTLASAGSDNQIILWDIPSRRPLGNPLDGHMDWVNTVAFSPDGATLVSGSRDMSVMLWITGLDRWQTRACRIANRTFNSEEQRLYLNGDDIRVTCGLAAEENLS